MLLSLHGGDRDMVQSRDCVDSCQAGNRSMFNSTTCDNSPETDEERTLFQLRGVCRTIERQKNFLIQCRLVIGDESPMTGCLSIRRYTLPKTPPISKFGCRSVFIYCHAVCIPTQTPQIESKSLISVCDTGWVLVVVGILISPIVCAYGIPAIGLEN